MQFDCGLTVACCFLVACGETRHAWGRGWVYVDERPSGVPRRHRLLSSTEFNDFFYEFLKKGTPCKIVIFATFPLRGYKREKRGRATDSVIPLRDLPCPSYNCYFISRFFLVNRDPYGKIEKLLYGSSEFPINRTLIHLGTKPRGSNNIYIGANGYKTPRGPP